MRSFEKQSCHFSLLRRHSRVGGNPDLWLSEIFNDGRSVGFAHEYGLRKYSSQRVPIFSRAKPMLRMPIADTRKSSEKTVSTSLPATPSFPRRRESRPSAFRNIQRLPQYGLCPRMQLQKYWSRQGVYVLPTKPAIFSDDGFSQIKRLKIN